MIVTAPNGDLFEWGHCVITCAWSTGEVTTLPDLWWGRINGRLVALDDFMTQVRDAFPLGPGLVSVAELEAWAKL
jgi:hypothetical protein